MIRNGGQVVYETKGDTLVVRVGGEIDHHSAVAVRAGIDEQVTAARPGRVLLELSRVDFMDSSGLGLIVGRLVTAKEIGCGVTVAGADARTLRIFEMAGLERMRGLTIEKRRENVATTMKGKKSS